MPVQWGTGSCSGLITSAVRGRSDIKCVQSVVDSWGNYVLTGKWEWFIEANCS